MNKQEFITLIEKYLSGNATLEEEQLLLNFFDSFQSSDQWDEDLLGDKRVVQAKILERLRTSVHPRPKGKGLAIVRTFRWRQVSVAAAILVGLSIGLAKRKPLYDWMNPVKWEQLSTRRGQRKVIELTDGTKVWLGPGSQLTYPGEFREVTREVTLNGSAFFDVAPDKNHPFLVHAQNIDTRVLGTSFMVRAYADQPDIAVTVLTGQVKVSDGKASPIDLLHDQQGWFDREKGVLEKRNYPDALQLLSERDGNYEFKGAPVPQIIADLQMEYNIRIRVQGNLSRCTFYGSLRRDENLEKFLTKLCLAINARLEKKEGTFIILKEGGC